MDKKNIKITNGFTLVELLAVISILALLLLLIVPKISSFISDITDKSNINSILSLDKTADLYFSKNMNNKDKKIVFDGKTDIFNLLETNGKKPDSGYVVVKKNGEVAIGGVYNNQCYIKAFQESKPVKVDDINLCSVLPDINS